MEKKTYAELTERGRRNTWGMNKEDILMGKFGTFTKDQLIFQEKIRKKAEEWGVEEVKFIADSTYGIFCVFPGIMHEDFHQMVEKLRHRKKHRLSETAQELLDYHQWTNAFMKEGGKLRLRYKMKIPRGNITVPFTGLHSDLKIWVEHTADAKYFKGLKGGEFKEVLRSMEIRANEDEKRKIKQWQLRMVFECENLEIKYEAAEMLPKMFERITKERNYAFEKRMQKEIEQWEGEMREWLMEKDLIEQVKEGLKKQNESKIFTELGYIKPAQRIS